MRSNWFFYTWSALIGGACFSLPYLWWPTEFGIASFIHLALSFSYLAILVYEKRDGGLLDEKRGIWRGYVGVVLFGTAIFGSLLAYRAFVLPNHNSEMKNEPNKAMEPIPVSVTIPAAQEVAPLTSMAHLWR
jgi:hypothetical protein